jgi:hypothetical protein
MISLRTRLILPLAYVFAASTAIGQLPELATPSTASGAATTAQFFGGASADNGLSFGNSFSSGQALDINGEIHVESAHIGTTGNLYLVAQVGEQLLFRDANGAYQPWDLNVATLQATTVNTNLKAVEALTIVDDVALGQAGVSGVTLNIFFAYDTSAMDHRWFYLLPRRLSCLRTRRVSPCSMPISTSKLSRLIAFSAMWLEGRPVSLAWSTWEALLPLWPA